MEKTTPTPAEAAAVFAENDAVVGMAPKSISADMRTMLDTWSSIDIKNSDNPTKAMVMRGLNDPDEQISAYINKTINMRHVMANYVEIVNEENGEIQTAPRIIIFDDKGRSYACVSRGVQMAIAQICSIYGEPPFEPFLKVKVVQRAVKRGSMLTLIPE